jgi:hypothetical protein
MDNKAVFTTRFVVEENSEIVYVLHDHEGDWQFFSNDEATEQDARVVAMDVILELDPSIQEILDIPPGTEAWREDKDTEWGTKEYEEEEEE